MESNLAFYILLQEVSTRKLFISHYSDWNSFTQYLICRNKMKIILFHLLLIQNQVGIRISMFHWIIFLNYRNSNRNFCISYQFLEKKSSYPYPWSNGSFSKKEILSFLIWPKQKDMYFLDLLFFTIVFGTKTFTKRVIWMKRHQR